MARTAPTRTSPLLQALGSVGLSVPLVPPANALLPGTSYQVNLNSRRQDLKGHTETRVLDMLVWASWEALGWVYRAIYSYTVMASFWGQAGTTIGCPAAVVVPPLLDPRPRREP